MNQWLRVLAVLGILILAVVGCQKGEQAGSTKSATPKIAEGVRSGSEAEEPHASTHDASRTAGATGGPSRAGGAASTTLTAADNGKTIDLRSGQTLVVVLDSNRSNGFSWVLLDSKTKTVAPDGAPAYAPPAGERVNGTETWRFHAIRPGEEIVRLEYRRAWAQDLPERTFRFTARVR